MKVCLVDGGSGSPPCDIGAKVVMKMGGTRVCWAGLLLAQLLVLAVLISGASSQASCDGKRPCAVNEEGVDSYDNSQVYRTAVGCIKSFTVNFRAGVVANASAPAPSVSICERQPSGACMAKPGVILTDFQRHCCQVPFRRRPPTLGIERVLFMPNRCLLSHFGPALASTSHE